MLIKVKRPQEVSSSEITPQGLYLDRRRFLRLGGGQRGCRCGPYKWSLGNGLGGHKITQRDKGAVQRQG